MDSLLLGQTAALGTALCWAFTSTFFTIAGRRVGSHVVNLVRLLLALLTLLVIHRLLYGAWLPLDAAPYRWGWLLLSGLIGLTLGDAALFQAFVMLGPRLSMLIFSLVPITTTVLAWASLGETLAWNELLAVPVTVAGVGWVVLERNTSNNGAQPGTREFALGVVFAMLGMLGQALGLITSRLGLDGDFSPLSATLMRTISATTALWLVPLFTGKLAETAKAVIDDRRALLFILAGTSVGPLLGVFLSLVAVQNAPVGIASTLMALTPIMVIPVVWVAFKERVSSRALGGTLLAVAGVALIFLV